MKPVPHDTQVRSACQQPAISRKHKPIPKRVPVPGNEPRIEPEYLDVPVPVSDPSVIERRVTMWC